LFFGAAIGNVIRGVPLGADGYFFEALWTNFRVGANTGILDWYTVLTGLLALVALTVQGASYIALKTEAILAARSQRTAVLAWAPLLFLTAASLIATISVRPQILGNFRAHWWGLIFPAIVVTSLLAMRFFLARGSDLIVFLSSTGYLIGMLGGAAFAMFP